ncbi:MAG: hypothetical protein P8I27_19610 [Pirellulaceae bacterium]|nr:hypothetical protein [Pirellulaceae bacterium]
MAPRKTRILIGILIWTVLLGWFGWRYIPSWFGERSPTTKSLMQFVFEKQSGRELHFEFVSNVRIGDPIFFEREGELVQVGKIAQVDSLESQNYQTVSTQWARATFFSSAPELQPHDYLTLHETPESMDWVARFLFPREKRLRIAELVTDVYATHSQEILSDLMPILLGVWTEASFLIRDELLLSLERHKPEFEALGRKYQTEIVEQQLIPLLGEEIWPVVLKQTKPILEIVGKEIWERASVFRFGWRAMYDASPLPSRNLTQSEFTRLVEQDAVPVFQQNMPQFMRAQQAILYDISQNRQVQRVLTGSLEEIVEDPEMQELILQILKEAILENEPLNQLLKEIWKREDLQQVLELTDARLEPTVVNIGEEVFGSPYNGVTPEFARILRNKILLKDERWLVLQQPAPEQAVASVVQDNDDPQVMMVLPGKSNLENPFYYPAKER